MRRGRDTGYPAPPAQIPACSFPAPGSSIVLASAILTIKDVVIPLREVGLHYPALRVRCKVSFEGYVPLSAPSPCERPYRLRVLWADPTPCKMHQASLGAPTPRLSSGPVLDRTSTEFYVKPRFSRRLLQANVMPRQYAQPLFLLS